MTNTTATTYQSFGQNFQDKLSFLILEDRIFSDRMMEVLKVEYLEKRYQQWFIDMLEGCMVS